eukprot:CAMPEP_0181033814 /NCGR_PEP_ID=MMETSP1070-20121207/7455_1 /TAXON_ID=265543 /ORGANISM="Minutocellus polymorphus, Strain NH13" /LENGTH=444 /DNA_ID=CAMNT_0023111261 /DNA_START=127 /DNA_END=1457 /DNA_ORIENTATION=+
MTKVGEISAANFLLRKRPKRRALFQVSSDKMLLSLDLWNQRLRVCDEESEEEDECDAEEEEDVAVAFMLHARRKVLLNQTSLPLHSRYRKTYYRNLHGAARRLRDRRIPRAATLSPASSPWQCLYDSGNEQALVTATGLDHAAFSRLLSEFEPLYREYTVDRYTGDIRPRKARGGGRPRLLNAAGCLGLTLMWTRTRGAEWHLAIVFGTTGTPTSFWIRFGRRILVSVLRKLPEGAICLPTEAELEEYVAAIAARHRHLGTERVWGAMDGLKLLLQRSGDYLTQNMYYNGWTCDHYVTNLFLFAPDGTIALRVTNCPGAVHDSTIAGLGNVYEKVFDLYERYGVKIVVDSAFASESNDSLIKSAQSTAGASNTREAAILLEATSMRQSSEWGMHSLQGTFPRLKDRFVYEERGDRKLMLEMVARLYNFRTRRLGYKSDTECVHA